MTTTAKLFMHGRSQAVRLPKEFRFEGKEVRISKVGNKVILEPLYSRDADNGIDRPQRTGYPRMRGA
jgi:antitoxin VapB